MIKVLALDPGKTTGYCYATIDNNEVILKPNEARWSPGELSKWLGVFTGQAIIYENFQFRQGIRTGLDMTPAKLIGILEAFQEMRPGIKFYCQQPSVQGDKAFFTNDRLKELGVYWPHGKGHARSATKHLLYWLKFGAGAQYVRDPVYKVVE